MGGDTIGNCEKKSSYKDVYNSEYLLRLRCLIEMFDYTKAIALLMAIKKELLLNVDLDFHVVLQT